MASNVQQQSLEQWVSLICNREMPIFGQTVQSVISVAEDDDAPAAKLAGVVLKDASMTARVLKLANSVHYNPQRTPMSTISRAVIVLGFKTVRNMCLSISLVDAFVKGNARDRLTHSLGQAIHAAVQARSIACERKDDSPEEVFIATLLYHIGDMAFWCFSGEAGDELDEVMQRSALTPEQAQQQVLGFPLREVSRRLAEEWHLNPLLIQTLNHPNDSGARGRNIALAHEVVAAAAAHGWEAPETQQVMQEIGKLAGSETRRVIDQIHRNAREAAEIATYYGAASAARAIPLPGISPTTREVKAERGEEYPQPDGMLQLRILRELAALMESGGDLNMIIEMVMEGIYRGVGMDRVLFALVSPDKQAIRAKFAVGHGNESLQQRFHFSREPNRNNLFFEQIDRGGVAHAEGEGGSTSVDSTIRGVVGMGEFFSAAVTINGKNIGILFADRALSGRKLDGDCFESFCHFAKQANMGLSLIAARR
ncbi:MAG: HDOD domain-containing protein [Chromatiales bacterium]|nr:HDOD domain-containing protein [Chromatiales bacterium]